jgi:hypothetical protein
MRAATWATNRDIAAAQPSWERARKIADALPADDPHRAAMRIAPRTMLCGIAYRVHMNVAGDRIDELRQLCTAAGDKASLAIAMAGLVGDHAFQVRVREASQLASEAWPHGYGLADADPVRALGAMRRGLVIAQDSGNRFIESHLAIIVSRLEAAHGDPLAAFEYFIAAVRNFHDAPP